MLEGEEERVVQEIEALVKKYDKWATTLQVTSVVLIIFSVSSSLAVGLFTGVKEINEVFIKVLAGLSALSTSLLTGLRLTKKSQDLRSGYRYLKYSLFQYKVLKGHSIEHLIAAFRNAEKMVGHVEYEGPAISKKGGEPE
jgi:hypothetical protein